jgi:hypothetical protein
MFQVSGGDFANEMHYFLQVSFQEVPSVISL